MSDDDSTSNTNNNRIFLEKQPSVATYIKSDISRGVGKAINLSQKIIGSVGGSVLSGITNTVTKLVLVPHTFHIPTHTGKNVCVSETSGSGSNGTLVIIHGFGGCSGDYLEFIRMAQYKFKRILTVDLPGHGKSELPEQYCIIPVESSPPPNIDWFFLSIIEAVSAVITSEENVSLIGVSMGGTAAIKVAAAIPNKITNLILSSPAGAPQDIAEYENACKLFNVKCHQDCSNLIDTLYFREVHFVENYIMTLISKERLSSPICEYFRQVFNILGHTYVPYSESELNGITTRTMLVWGSDDKLFPNKRSVYYKRIPNLHIEHIDKMGHIPMAEDPVMFLELIERFVSTDSTL